MSSHITISGNLTADAELKFPNGTGVLEFTVAVNHGYKKDGQWVDEGSSFWRVALWRQDADAYAEKLLKGTPVVVNGEPRIRQYETREGVKGKSPEIHRAVVGIRVREPRDGQARPQQTQQADPWATPAQGGFSDEPPF